MPRKFLHTFLFVVIHFLPVGLLAYFFPRLLRQHPAFLKGLGWMWMVSIAAWLSFTYRCFASPFSASWAMTFLALVCGGVASSGILLPAIPPTHEDLLFQAKILILPALSTACLICIYLPLLILWIKSFWFSFVLGDDKLAP